MAKNGVRIGASGLGVRDVIAARALAIVVSTAFLLAPVLFGFSARPSLASDRTIIAVATNFLKPMEELRSAFLAASHPVAASDIVIVSGASGKLYAQIAAGAPFALLLSADAAIPARIEAEGLAVAGTRKTYAIGRLVLWSTRAGMDLSDGPRALADPTVSRVAIANPLLAPYGIAARETLDALGLWAALQPRLVMGQNIGHAQALVASGAAELGLIALSGVTAGASPNAGSDRYWLVPSRLHQPIRQDMVVLARAVANDQARAFHAFLQSPAARAIIERHGYELP